MRKCQFEPVGQSEMTRGCTQVGEYLVCYQMHSTDGHAHNTSRRYCLTHANRVRDYLEQAGLIARVVRA